jgi:hypothetical protein
MHHGYRSPRLSRISETVIGWLTDQSASALETDVAGWDDEAWEAARWAIQVHGIGPLLDRALEQRPNAEALHPRLRAYLADQRRLSGERVRLLLQDLGELLTACDTAGIALLPMKGSLLATLYYPEPGLRPMNDLDLLVRPDDEARTLRVLAGLGYRSIARTLKHITIARPEHQGPIVSYTGEHPANPRSIDLHTRVHEFFWGIRYDLTDDVWADSDPGLLLGAPARLFRPVALLHHLAAHATGDLIVRRIRLLHLLDIALVAPLVDAAGWERIVTQAQACHEERMLYPALAMTNRYYPVVPAAVLRELRGGVAPELLRHLDSVGLVDVSFSNVTPSTLTEKLRWFRPGWERVRAMRYAVLPDPGDLALMYPRLNRPALRPLAYARYSIEIGNWLARRMLRRPRLKLLSFDTRKRDRGM